MFAHADDVASTGVDVSPAREEELGALLPLIAAYQRFYEAQSDDERNRAFFRRFIAPSDDGIVLAARDDAGDPVGFATVYWTFSSVSAEPVALMNDLYVVAEQRGTGTGRKLIDAAADAARERGIAKLSWMTAPGNKTAQRLYDSTGATRSTWLEYELDL
jgi:GNAT superfamily N-acetyltransferase